MLPIITPHLTEIVHHFPSIYDRAQESLLIGKDLPEAHHVQVPITGQKGIPFAQNLALTWTFKGETCIGKFQKPDVHINKNLDSRKRPSYNVKIL